tara:strand:- start:25 stop:429 length:405 start_codon:yes stop_codon:yes gene_type:complete
MKKLLLLLFIVPIISFSQTSFSAKYKEVCDWKEYDSEWETDCRGLEDYSLFVMNSEETMFTHTTSNMKSTYYVKTMRSSQEDIDDALFMYDVVSDVGNEYFAIFDMKHKEVKMVSTSGEQSEWYMVRWYIKSIF